MAVIYLGCVALDALLSLLESGVPAARGMRSLLLALLTTVAGFPVLIAVALGRLHPRWVFLTVPFAHFGLTVSSLAHPNGALAVPYFGLVILTAIALRHYYRATEPFGKSARATLARLSAVSPVLGIVGVSIAVTSGRAMPSAVLQFVLASFAGTHVAMIWTALTIFSAIALAMARDGRQLQLTLAGFFLDVLLLAGYTLGPDLLRT